VPAGIERIEHPAGRQMAPELPWQFRQIVIRQVMQKENPHHQIEAALRTAALFEACISDFQPLGVCARLPDSSRREIHAHHFRHIRRQQ